MSQDTTDLSLAVQALWTACGETAPAGDELAAAATTFRKALEVGRKIPRVTDKTFQPLVGPRRDLEL
ncbi:hypothetical protein [Neorhizobium sp. JUb45]|uniref:hypothetical protein n=1 Tax=unclassified Neorhizobium TaxID=2629175 RepID=UPI0010483096|nr:hypothetical protein [Neorhizobium sp. JUb45]TCQ99952.1 hypothetical protein EDF70_10730 [Neorhizobium sp. JUb45]